MTRASSSDRRGGGETPLARLSRPPRKAWPDGVLHHGTRVLLLLGIALVVTLLFPPSEGARVANYDVGSVSDEAIIASRTFDVPKNEEELERERAAAAAAVPPVFHFQPDALETMDGRLDRFFGSLREAGASDNPEEAVQRVLSDQGLVISPRQRDLLTDSAVIGMIETAARQAVAENLPRGVLDEGAVLGPGTPGRILVLDPDGPERFVPQDSVLTSREFYQNAARFLPPGSGSEVNELLRLSLIRYMEPSLRFDASITQEDRDAARRAVPTTRSTVLQGEAIVRANQRVGESEVERLRAYEEALRADGELGGERIHIAAFVGSWVLNLLVLGAFGFLVFFFRSDVYGNFRWLTLQAILILAFAGAAGIVAANRLPAELLPIAFVSLAMAVLWDGRLALILAVTLAALTGAQEPFQSIHAWMPVFVAGAAAALSVRAVRRRAQTWVFIAIIASAYATVLLALGALSARDAQAISTSFGWAAGNAVVSAILAMGFLPVFEWFTRITTDQTLLEWADPNRPLLKRLSMEAPGTYAHTINVANLSEAAANAIGADGLLCRVGVYYHDVGKMLKPQYFIENQPSGHNPHDKLKSATSAAIVREHVTEGIRLAEEAKLPQVLIDFIPEHHGTQEISFFYERARAEVGDEGELDPEEFRYPGPRPQSRETAIVMLADSVESATRTLQDPTPERVRDLIDSIVENKISDSQLDEAPLTLGEMGTIKTQFQKVLAGTHHHRIDYPSTRHLTESGSGRDAGADGRKEDRAEADTGAKQVEAARLESPDREVAPALFPVEGERGRGEGPPGGEGER